MWRSVRVHSSFFYGFPVPDFGGIPRCDLDAFPPTVRLTFFKFFLLTYVHIYICVCVCMYNFFFWHINYARRGDFDRRGALCCERAAVTNARRRI